MTIVTSCPHCGQRYTVQSTAVGENASCMKCGQDFIIIETPPKGLGTMPRLADMNDGQSSQKSPRSTSSRTAPLVKKLIPIIVAAIGIVGTAVVYYSGGCNRMPSEVRHILAEAATQKKAGRVEFWGFFPGMTEDQLTTLAKYYGLSYSLYGKTDIVYSQRNPKSSVHFDSIDTIEFRLVAIQRITKCGPSVQEIADAVAARIGPMANDVKIAGTRLRYDNVYGETALFMHDIKSSSNTGLFLFGAKKE